MPSFWERIRQAIDRALGRDQAPETVPDQPNVPPEYEEDQPQQDEIIIEEEYTPPPEEEYPEPEESGCVTGYYPGRVEGQRVRVKPRYYANNPDINCIRSILSAAGNRSYYTLIVCGTPLSEYPEKEGETHICLGYKYPSNLVIQVAYGSGVATATDFANGINSLEPYHKLVGWGDISEVSVLDV